MVLCDCSLCLGSQDFLLVCWKSWEIGITHLTDDQAVLRQLSRKFVPNTVSIIRLLPNYVTTKTASL